MSNTLYCSEISAQISAYLHKNPDHVERIAHVMQRSHDPHENVITLCAEAARVLDTIEDLSGEHFIDWHEVYDHYANAVLDHLLMVRVPTIADLILMAAQSLQMAKSKGNR